MGYRYETHMHTKEGSGCGRFTGIEHARRYKELGYTGIIVTDHFFNGNCGVPRDLPWEEMARLFALGYYNAKAEGERIGLDVFFGWEAAYQGTEFLIYGLSPEWLIAHPEVMQWSIAEEFRMVSEAGGLVVQAHPYREASYIPEVRIMPEYCHAMEVYNEGNVFRDPGYNDKALAFAKAINKPMTAGTDAHGGETSFVGIECSQKLESIEDYIKLIKSGQGYTLMDPIS